MNSVFSVDDLTDSFWATVSPATAEAAAAVMGDGMSRSQSVWAFQRPIARSLSATLNAIGRSLSPIQSEPSVSRPSGAGADMSADFVEIQKPENHRRRGDEQGCRNHGSSSSSAVRADPDQYYAILKSKLDLACAAVALRVATVKPDESGVSATNQRQPPLVGSQAQGAAAPQTSPDTSSIHVSPSPESQNKSGAPVRQATSGSSRDDSDDDELDGDTETTENADPADAKRARRILSNRESARRSRRRKQEQMIELESQVGQLRIEHSTWLKRLSDMNHSYDMAAVDNRILKADIETLRTKVKMAEETVKRVTGMNPLLLARPNTTNMGIPMDSSRIGLTPPQPNSNHILKPGIPTTTETAQNQRLENTFGNSTLVPPNVNPVTNTGEENMTKIPRPQQASTSNHLPDQVNNHFAPGADPYDTLPH